MAGDKVEFNTRERAVSGDLNDAQALATRQLADVLRYSLQLERVQTSTPNVGSDRNVVLGGLIPSASGSDIAISPGALAQYSAGMLPVPGSLDSGERVAFLRSATSIACPVPGADTVYLLEAQMVDVVTLSTTRDVLDPGPPPVFVPTTVNKRIERQITFRFRAGTATAAPAADAEWVPIAIVWRLSGAGAVAAADVWDVRPLAGSFETVGPVSVSAIDIAPGRAELRKLETVGTIASSSPNLRFEFRARDARGNMLFARNTDASVSIASLPQDTLTSGQLAYFYLVRDESDRVMGNRIPGVAHRGMLVVSNVAPTKGGVNSGVITLNHGATPWGFDTVLSGRGVCVGCVRYVAGVINPIVIANDEARTVTRTLQAIGGPPTAGGLTDFSFAGIVPTDARIVRVRLYVISAGGVGGPDFIATITDQATGGTPDPQSVSVYWHGTLNYAENTTWFDIDLPVGIATSFRLNTSAASTQPASIQLDVVGWVY